MEVLEDEVFNKELEELRFALIKHLERHPPQDIHDVWCYIRGYMFDAFLEVERERVYTVRQIIRLNEFTEKVWTDFISKKEVRTK